VGDAGVRTVRALFRERSSQVRSAFGLFAVDSRAVVVDVEQETSIDATAGDAKRSRDGSSVSVEDS
jgi:hypothetical protein